MENTVELGLLGRNISYSFSKTFFEKKFKELGLKDYQYHIFDRENISDVSSLFSRENLRGFNVTIPYKQQIIPYLDELSPEAQEIRAVNTVLVFNGKRKGFNTDAYGFEKTLIQSGGLTHQKALVLGDGGAAKAIQYVLRKHNISFKTISRKGTFTFQDLSSEVISEHMLVIQCTPVGTFPDTEKSVPFPFEHVTSDHLMIDLIYNPAETLFLRQARLRGAKTINGALMLEQQAEKAWEIWNIEKK